MSLDVHLRRSSNESWGFRLVGGADSETPLTIVKVKSLTPAQTAGLQDGDKLVRLHGVPAEILTHEEADIIIRSCHEDIVMKVERGRYDAVMDDQEASFEPIDLLDDFVQQSEPTEVQIPTPTLPIEQTIEETRSLTASPFLVPAKPYRPFSTEPIPEITPVEDPIILNPNFHDEFIKSLEEYLPKTKFKLPVSEQYDPNFGKEKKDCKENGRFNFNIEGNVNDSKTNECVIDYNQNYTAEEIKQIKQANIDIDLSKIEESTYNVQEFKTEQYEIKENIDITPITNQSIREIKDSVSTTNKTEKEFSEIKVTDENMCKTKEIKKNASVFVDETIEQAKTVAAIIKNELEVAFITDLKETENKSDSTTKTEKVHESVSSLKQKFEDQTNKDASVSQVKQDVIEVTEAGKVKNIASSFEKDVDTNVNTRSEKIVEKKQISSSTENKKTQDYRTTIQSRTSTEHHKTLNEQKAYVLGLQTIPNIRGTINSSKHFDMLLKTFFIHLTDVMVALSRFILVEPAFTKENHEGSENFVERDTQEVITKEQIFTKVDEVNKISSKENQKKSTNKITEQQVINDLEQINTGVEMQRKDKKKESNIKMALMSSQTSEEVAHKMEAVISEFQTKSGIEDTHEDNINLTEYKTLEMIEKEESANLIQTENISESNIFSDTIDTAMTATSDHTFKGTEAKNTYMAIVEAHVYTNKEAIMEMAIKSSDTSRKSSIEELKSNVYEISEENVDISNIEDTNISRMLQEKVQVAQIEEIQPVISVEFEFKDNIAVEDKTMAAQEENTFLNVKENLKRVSIVDEILVEESQNLVQNTAISIDEVVEKLETEILSKQTSNNEEKISQIVEKTETNEFEKTELSSKKYDSLSSVKEIETTATQQAINEVTVSQQQTTTKQEEILVRKEEHNFVSQEMNESIIAIAETQITHKADSSKLSLDLKSETKTKKNYPLTPNSSTPSTIDTPTPSTVPPTPLTDEYIFRLEAPMPKNRGTPTPTPVTVPVVPEEHEDPHIVKKRMIPHIDTNIERIVYDPPLLTPEVGSGLIFEERPFDTKPISREEIKEIERTSSLLASAIDETIKSIEEYKEQVGIETTKDIDATLAPNLNANTTLVPNLDVLLPNLDTSDAEKVPNIYSGTVQEAKTIVYSQPTIDIQQKSCFKQTQENINISSTTDATTTTEISGFRSVKFMPEISDQSLTAGIESTKIEDVSAKMSMRNEEMMTRTEELKESEIQNEDPTYRPVHFDPNEFKRVVEYTQQSFESMQETQMTIESTTVKTMTGTHQGIVDSLEKQIMDSDTAKELGKPGISEEKIAELMSGESEMLREAHVMGLKRVLNSHMHRTDDENSSVDFMKIKPTIDSLRDSEVLKALNDEIIQKKIEEKKKEEKDKGTTFLQKPKRPVPTAKHGYHGWLPEYELIGEPYRVKIIKQPKPKVAPDYNPKVFETGPLPWEERAANEPPPPPVLPEDPILIPEEGPQFLEAVDPLPESEVPDLEDTGILLPPEEIEEDQDKNQPSRSEEVPGEPTGENLEVLDIEKVIEETEQILLQDMEENKIAEQLMSDVQSMVDPNATLEQQLTQMRAQLAALAQLPCVIQQTLDLVTKQLSQLTQQGSSTEVVTESKTVVETTEMVEVTETSERVEESTEQIEEIIQHVEEVSESHDQVQVVQETKEEIREESMKQEIKEERMKQEIKEERMTQEIRENSMKQEMRENTERVRRESYEIMDESRRIEMQKKDLIEQLQQEQESRQLKQRPTPRVGKPKPVFGPLTPQERPLVLPGGRKWRKPADAYNEQFIAETLQAQAEIIQGKTKGSTYESHHLPYDERINFMKYEKPPISLDHLKDSDVYKMVHNMDQGPTRRVDMLTSVIAECDYREKCRAATPAAEKTSR